MQAPNVVSIAVIVGIMALCEGLADTLPILGEPWVPFAVIALGALVLGLKVYLQGAGGATRAAHVSNTPLRRWLVG